MTATPQFWCTESLLVTVNGPQGRSTIAVDKPFARIGSHSRSEILLTGEGIDARCLYLHATPEGIFCVRLLATPGMTLGSGSWLKPNELLQVGPYEISAQLQRGGSLPPPRVALTAWGSSSPPLPVCEISSNGKIRDKRRFRARLNLVGRRRELALQLQGQQVSSCHCALYWDSGRLWCIDLLSSNGTQLQDQSIDCALLEIGQSLQIGEFALLLKRLSRATARQSAWRTGESDDDVLTDAAVRLEAEPPPGSLAQTISAASGDTGKVQPTPAIPSLVPPPNTDLTVARRLLVGTQEDLRQHQDNLPEEFTQRSEQLIAQRRQLDQQWHQTSQEVASQVSQLKSESALLAAQRQEMVKLRADWEEQYQILSADLKNWRQELSQRQGLLDEQKRVPSRAAAAALAPFSQVLDQEVVVDQEELSGAPNLSGSELTIGALAGSQTQRGPLPTTGPFRTVIEGSYVVEKENPRTDFAARRAPFQPDSPRSPVQPIGRRHSSESRPVASAPADAQSKEDVKPPVSPVSDQETQGLSIVEPSASSTAVRLEEGVSRPFAGRRKQADEDRMGAFVTDRLVQREEARRIWLRVLWGVAAAVSLLALATLAYIVLSARAG